MGATSDNYDIVTSGTTYTIASDFVNDAHYQINKVAFGTNDTAILVSEFDGLPVNIIGTNATPLEVDLTSFSYGTAIPVTLQGVTVQELNIAAGNTLNLNIDNIFKRYDYTSETGYDSLAVSIVGNGGMTFNIVGVSGGRPVAVTFGAATVSATDLDIRNLFGGAVGATSGSTSGIDYLAVQGIAGAYPVGITVNSTIPVSVSSFANLGIFGVSGGTAINVQATDLNIRGLTAVSDTVTVYGGGTAGTVSVGLFGFTGATASPIYAESNALNVNIKSSTGITVSALNLDIRDLSYISDTVTVVGQGAADTNSLNTVPTYMNAQLPNGTLSRVGGITGSGWSGSALNVNMVNAGITFTVVANATFSAQVGITAAANGAIPVQGSQFASRGIWVSGGTNGEPVTVRGANNGLLPIELAGFTAQTGIINGTIGQVKTNTDFMAAVKKALYSSSVSVGAFDFNDANSIYTLIKDSVGSPVQGIRATVVPNGAYPTTQDSVSVTLVGSKQQPKFMARTGNATYTPQNLTAFNAAGGYTCANGVRIKASRIASGTGGSQNQIMCVISEADAAVYGATAGAASYVLYHGDEMFFEVDNINKIRVFYPAYSASFAPHNTGNNMTFSFYAS
jgi:hypothetical protein